MNVFNAFSTVEIYIALFSPENGFLMYLKVWKGAEKEAFAYICCD